MRFALAALAGCTLLIHGYHPLAEDGGLYVAGVEYTLQPTLFPRYTAFVTEHLGYSIFAPLLAGAVRCSHLPLSVVLLLACVASLLLSFYSAHQLLRRCVASQWSQLGGLALLAAWWTLPIAGTSLMLMDPYLTARSFSTPLSLLAIALALDDWPVRRKAAWPTWRSACGCALVLAAAALLHPLMATYALAFVIALRAARLSRSWRAFAGLAFAALGVAAILQAHAQPEPPEVFAAALSRYYWFLSQWQWYELLGLAGPIIILLLLGRSAIVRRSSATVLLIHASIFAGLTAVLVALLYAHQNSTTHAVARLQPLRIFLLLYAVMTLLLGSWLTQTCATALGRTSSTPKRRLLIALPCCVFATMAATFFFVQRATYPASPHLELPGRQARNTNPWVEAFLWSRAHTPPDALFALDAKYVNEEGEDAQTFRAWALRSALPDFSKDGGEAAISPALAAAWQTAATAQRGLSTEDDHIRDVRILPLGATWMIVHATAQTKHPCPYDNGVIKVCQLQGLPASTATRTP
jgi:hypothetical protein